MRVKRGGVGVVGRAATCTVEFGLGSGVSGRCCETKRDGSACIFNIMAEN